MEIIRSRSFPKRGGPPLILLPGAYMRAQDFVTHGFVAAALGTAAAEIIAVETGMEPNIDDSIVSRLHEVISAARGDGVRVWLAGVSLGGWGALLYAKAHPDAVAGLLLLSPFIGTRGAIAEVIQAGGFEHWRPPTGDAATGEHRLLEWLKSYRPGDAGWPDIHLAYGEDDRFAASYRLLAGLLPPARVLTAAGGHDWKTWTVLWSRLLHSAGLCAV